MSSGMQFTRGALFDLDGVLVDSLAVMRLAFEGAYRDVYGADGTDLQRLFGRFRNHLGEGLESIVAALGLSAALIPHFRRHSRALSPQVRVYPGVRDMLRALSLRGWVLGVATGKDHERADELLRALDLRQRFAVVLGCDSPSRSDALTTAPPNASSYLTPDAARAGSGRAVWQRTDRVA